MVDSLLDYFSNKPLYDENANNWVEYIEHKLVALEEALRKNELNKVDRVLNDQCNNSREKPDCDSQYISELLFT